MIDLDSFGIEDLYLGLHAGCAKKSRRRSKIGNWRKYSFVLNSLSNSWPLPAVRPGQVYYWCPLLFHLLESRTTTLEVSKQYMLVMFLLPSVFSPRLCISSCLSCSRERHSNLSLLKGGKSSLGNVEQRKGLSNRPIAISSPFCVTHQGR